MTVWVVRAGKNGEYEESAISKGVSGIDFAVGRSVEEFGSRDALRDYLSAGPNAGDSNQKTSGIAGQVWNFARAIRDDDTIILPRKRPRVVAVGKVVGPYQFQPWADTPHLRPVEWTATDIPRDAFDKDLLYSMGGLATVFRVGAQDAESRISRIVAQHQQRQGVRPVESIAPLDAIEYEAPPVDLEEQAKERILDLVRQKFAGNRLEELVASILDASGYKALQTRPGPDGGVDVVAGRGEMGFDQPRLCVQVKSGRGAVDLPDYNRLQGNIKTYGADHGLLVSLGDFTRTVRNENERSYFEIRLWGPEELVDKLLETYDKLSETIRQDLPLRNLRIPVETNS